MEQKKYNKLQRNIKCIDLRTNDIKYFNSKYQCGFYCQCSPALIYLICEHKNRVKTCRKEYTFEYCDDDNIEIEENKIDGRIGFKYIKQNDENGKIFKIKTKKDIQNKEKQARGIPSKIINDI